MSLLHAELVPCNIHTCILSHTCLVNNDSTAPHVVSARADSKVSRLELDKPINLGRKLEAGWCLAGSGGRLRGCGKDKLDRVIDLDGRVRVADRAAVVGDDVRNTLCTELNTLDLGKLVYARSTTLERIEKILCQYTNSELPPR
jgi:hypothetical protein